MSKWDGKSKGSLWGYKFFVYLVKIAGLRVSYLFCYPVAFYYLLFMKNEREGLIQYYQVGLGQSYKEAKKNSFRNFYEFGQNLIDRVAMATRHKSKFTHNFNNEIVLRNLQKEGKGGILISAHLGNWEIAGNLIHDRITSTINILMLDAEVEKIKSFMEMQTGGPKYNLIPIKDDLSHLILIHKALKRNELIALHADRIGDENTKSILLPFLNSEAKFPLGPFIIGHKFKVPVTFVYAVKTSNTHYELFATDPLIDQESEVEISKQYVEVLEEKVKKYPTQWFNFYKYYAS